LSETSDHRIVEEMRSKSRHLESLLDDFSNRLRRMRQRNREVESELSEFEGDLERLRDWLQDVTPRV
jgi:predicted nuclease with TOPRIM domain